MDWRKTTSVLVTALLLVGLVAGCGSSNAGKSAEKTLRMVSGAEPETLDPRKATGGAEMNVLRQIFEGLCTHDAKGEIVPGVAERWDISPDGLKYTFYLRENAKWSNGDPVTAQDFEYAWKTALSPELGSRYAEQLYCLKNAEAYNNKKAAADQVGVKAINGRTLEVTLERPTPYFLSLVTFWTYYPVHQKTVEANDKWNTDPKTIISNGPFKMAGWTHNSKIQLVKNEHYWHKEVVKSEKVELVLTENNKTALDMFESNQVDVVAAQPPNGEIPRLLKANLIKTMPYPTTVYYFFNVTKAPFDNPKVRKALSLALNRGMFSGAVLKAGEKPALAFVPFALPDAKPGEEFRTAGGDLFKDNDVETAKKLLAEAGYPDGKGLPKITLLYFTNDNAKAMAEVAQEMWKKNLGVNVELANQEWKVYMKTCEQGDFQLAFMSWTSDFYDPMGVLEIGMTGNGNNFTRWSNAEYDRLLKEAQFTIDPVARMRLMHAAEKVLIEDMPVIPLYFDNRKILEKPNAKGVIRALVANYLREAYVE